jgi:hypothetical protein
LDAFNGSASKSLYFYFLQLLHFWQICGWRCHKALGGQARAGPPKQRALRVLDGNEQRLEDQCWRELQRIVAEADEYRAGGRHASALERDD